MKFDTREDSSVKIRNLLEYFNGNGRKDKTNKRFERSVNLEKMIEIYNDATLNDIRKLDEMSKIYKNSSLFIKQFIDLQKYSDDEMLSYYANITKAIGDYYQRLEENGTKANGKLLLEMEEKGYFEDYRYACYFIEQYIEYEESPYLKDFLNHEGISQNDFLRFAHIVMELNSELYDRFTIKFTQNRNERKYNTIVRVNNLASGIENGYTKDGTVFDEIEFYRNLPFYDKDSAQEIANDFDIKSATTVDKKMRKLIDMVKPESTKAITDYMYKNQFFGSNPTTLSKKEIKNITFIKDGIRLSEEDKDVIVKYMEETGVPIITRSFDIVKKKYISEGLRTETGLVLKK